MQLVKPGAQTVLWASPIEYRGSIAWPGRKIRLHHPFDPDLPRIVGNELFVAAAMGGQGPALWLAPNFAQVEIARRRWHDWFKKNQQTYPDGWSGKAAQFPAQGSVVDFVTDQCHGERPSLVVIDLSDRDYDAGPNDLTDIVSRVAPAVARMTVAAVLTLLVTAEGRAPQAGDNVLAVVNFSTDLVTLDDGTGRFSFSIRNGIAAPVAA